MEYCVTTTTPILINATGDLVNISYRVNNTGAWINITGLLPYTFNFSAYGECTHTLNITAIDSIGRVIWDNETFHVDDTAPVIEKTVGTPNCTLASDVYCINTSTPIFINVSAGCCSNVTVELSDNNITVPITELPVYFFIGPEGIHTVSIKATDCFGRTTYDNETFYVDETAPELTKTMVNGPYCEIVPNASYCVNLSTAINVTATNGGCCPDTNLTVTYRIWNGTWTDWQNYTGNINFAEECVHYLDLNVSDCLGNSFVDREIFYVDETAPEINKTVGEPSSQRSPTEWDVTMATPITINATTGGCCANLTVEYRIWYNGVWGSWTDISNELPYVLRFSENCTHYLEINASDCLGNFATDNETFYVNHGPEINVTKTIVSTGPYHAGDNITYNITVCNIGNVAVTNVTINDPLLGLTDFVLVGTLAPNNCTSMPLQNYTVKEYDVCTGWINNTVNASADYGTETIYNESFANVSLGYDSALNVTKVAETNGGAYRPGDNITYNVTVCNLGKLTVTNVTVNDPILGIVNDSFGTLAPGNCSSKKFNYTVTRDDCGWLNNTVEVKGKDYCGNVLRATAAWNVSVECGNCISGYKLNESGVGLANWTINVKNSTGAVIANDTTNDTGYWEICGLAPGDYVVCEELQTGWEAVDPASGCIDITLGTANITGQNFTNSECNGSISDFVWLDENEDGIQDPGELGLAGVTVNLYQHEDGNVTLLKTTVTDGTGFYIFENLCAGTYSLQFIPPPGYRFSPQDQGTNTEDSDVDPTTKRTDVFELGDGEINITIDAGLYYFEQAPAFTPGGLIALISLLATIAALNVRRKRR